MLDIKVEGIPINIMGDKIGLQFRDRTNYRTISFTPSHLDCLIAALMKAKRELGMAPTKHTEEQKKQVLFKCLNPGCPPLRYRAWVKESPNCFGDGKTQEEAFGALARTHPEVFNVEFVYAWHETPPTPPVKEAANLVTTPPLPLLPQKGMMVQFHDSLYAGTGRTASVAALVVGETPAGLTLKLFRSDGREEIVRDIKRGGEGQSRTWEFVPCKIDQSQQSANQAVLESVESALQRQVDDLAATIVNKPWCPHSASDRHTRTLRAKMIDDLRAQGQDTLAERIEKIAGPDNPKLLAFPCDDVTCEVDFDGCLWISDHENIVGVDLKDAPAVIDSLKQLVSASRGAQ